MMIVVEVAAATVGLQGTVFATHRHQMD